MKKILLLTMVFCFTVAGFSYAESKIGVIDIQGIMMQSKAGAKASGELKTLGESAVKKLKAKEAEVKKLADDINKQKSSLSQTALQNKNIELNKKSLELERMQKDLQTELQTQEAMKLDAILKELEPVVNDYAKEKGFDVIFIKQPGIMAYANPEVDVTKDIISRFDIKWSKKGTN